MSPAAFQDDVGGQGSGSVWQGLRQDAMEFGEFDVNNDGVLDFREFSTLVRQREVGIHSELALAYRFQELDPENKGFVQMNEYILYSLRDALKRSSDRTLDLFKAWDEDGSGEISAQEFRKLLRSIGFEASNEEFNALFAKLDFVDQSGNVSYLELHRKLKQQPSLPDDSVQREIAISAHQQRTYRRGTNLMDKVELDAKALDAPTASGMARQLRGLLRNHVTRVMDLFRAFDEDNSGMVDRREFLLGMRSLGVRVPKAVINSIFDSFDVDGNEQLEYRELKRQLHDTQDRGGSASSSTGERGDYATGHLVTRSASETNVRPRLLQNFTIDADRSIQRQLTDAIHHSKEKILNLFRQWDENGDGLISMRELQRALRQLGLTSGDDGRKVVDELFEKLDKDASGAIDYAELLSGLQQSVAPETSAEFDLPLRPQTPGGWCPRQRQIKTPALQHYNATWDAAMGRFILPEGKLMKAVSTPIKPALRPSRTLSSKLRPAPLPQETAAHAPQISRVSSAQTMSPMDGASTTTSCRAEVARTTGAAGGRPMHGACPSGKEHPAPFEASTSLMITTDQLQPALAPVRIQVPPPTPPRRSQLPWLYRPRPPEVLPTGTSQPSLLRRPRSLANLREVVVDDETWFRSAIAARILPPARSI